MTYSTKDTYDFTLGLPKTMLLVGSSTETDRTPIDKSNKRLLEHSNHTIQQYTCCPRDFTPSLQLVAFIMKSNTIGILPPLY